MISEGISNAEGARTYGYFVVGNILKCKHMVYFVRVRRCLVSGHASIIDLCEVVLKTCPYMITGLVFSIVIVGGKLEFRETLASIAGYQLVARAVMHMFTKHRRCSCHNAWSYRIVGERR